MEKVCNVVLALVLLLSTSLTATGIHAQPSVEDEAPPALQARNTEFLAAVDSHPPRQLAGFFPRAGEVVYRHTVYADDGTTVREQRFSANDLPAALEGPLWAVFTSQVEGQVVGLFAHQVSLRGRRWTYAGNHRFVPPGASRCSASYVQWRLENGAWVISGIADEEYRTDALPPWCC